MEDLRAEGERVQSLKEIEMQRRRFCDEEERDEIILVLMIYGFGLCWVCNVFEEIYGMRRKMTKPEMGCFGLC